MPKTIAYCPKLTQLGLGGNPLIFPPPGVIEKGDAAALEFLKRHRHTDLASKEEGYAASLAAA